MAFQGNKIVGEGTDSIGTFSITGQRSPAGEVVFNKQYHGQHSVAYKGQMIPDGSSMHGSYKAGGNVGSFIMAAQKH